MNILRMINPVQPYAWGSKTFISELLGKPEQNGAPQAELWLGAHPKSSSLIQNGDLQVNLSYIIAEDPGDFLGNNIARSYHDQLPFLLKVLAAAAPLSIQAHPNQKQAREGFAHENKLGIPIDADKRNYKDANHKPELIVALTSFTAMCGFRAFPELVSYLNKYLTEYESEQFANFLSAPNPQSLQDFFGSLLNLSKAERQELLSPYLNKITQAQPDTEQEKLLKKWSIELYRRYPDDIGVLSPLLLNIIELQPFEGLYLQAGILHSYLQGAGMEIMANSDNVLRGGLTPKHIDTDELLRVVDFQPIVIKPVIPKAVSDTENSYQTPALEFALSILRHESEKQTVLPFAGSPEVLFCYEGGFVIENCSQLLSLEKGQSLFVPYEVEGYIVQGKGVLFRARCNL
jgi:mannose-6-phosphate isomerase